MKLENVKVGEECGLQIGKNRVLVTVKEVSATGTITVVTKAGKRLAVSDAGRLTVQTAVDQVAHGARGKTQTPKATKAAGKRAKGQGNAPEAKEKRLGALAAAVKILKDAKAPMGARDIMKAILDAKLWTTAGKTPASTLYAAMTREIAAKGAAARFRRAAEPKGAFELAN